MWVIVGLFLLISNGNEVANFQHWRHFESEAQCTSMLNSAAFDGAKEDLAGMAKQYNDANPSATVRADYKCVELKR